jgi:hypothetical protein
MIPLDDADAFASDLRELMEKHMLGVYIDDCQDLQIAPVIYSDNIENYIENLLDNTARK